MDPANTYPAPHLQTAGRVIDGEAVLHLAEANEVQVLNGVGSRIFELSNGERNLAEIASVLTDEYNVDLNEALVDVCEFVQQLVDNQVLVIRDGPIIEGQVLGSYVRPRDAEQVLAPQDHPLVEARVPVPQDQTQG